MIVRRAPPRQQFTVLQNDIHAAGLSMEATAVLVYLLSKPADWKPQRHDLETRFNCGRRKVQSALRELCARGFATFGVIQLDNGALAGRGYTIFDESCAERITAAVVSADDDEAESDENGATDTADSDCESVPNEAADEHKTGSSADEPVSRRSQNRLVGNIIKTDITNTPLYPPASGGGEAAGPADEAVARRRPPAEAATPAIPQDLDREWLRFDAGWAERVGWKDGDNRERARRRFFRLAADERREAIDRLDDYARWRRAHGKPPVSAGTWLRDRYWKNIAAPPPMVFVRKGTPGWMAWEQFLRATGVLRPGQPLYATTVREEGRTIEGTWRATLFPPPAQAATGPPGRAA